VSTVDVTQNLRPLKLAYIVRPNDMASLRKVIETNCFLWGARYNPILPLYKRKPIYLKENYRINKINELLYGNLRFFEPDFIVITGDIQVEEIKEPPCEIIKLSDIYESIKKEGLPGYGIGLWEIFVDYYDKEFKFLRRDKRSHIYPSYSQGHNCFLKSVFGCFPEELPKIGIKKITEALEAKKESITLDNYLSYFEFDEPIDIHHLTSYKLKIDYSKHTIRERDVIFILDPNSFVDIVDYANLKAAGYRVCPILRNLTNSDQAKKICLEFIEDKAWVLKENPAATFSVTMQRSQSVTKEELANFYSFVDPPKFENQDTPKCFMSFDLPDFWSRWSQEKGHVSCVSMIAEKKRKNVTLEGRNVRSETFGPSFISKRIPKAYTARFANEVTISTYAFDSKTFGADIYPSNSDEVARAAGLRGKREWLIKDSGITNLCKSNDSPIFFQVNNGEEIFSSWLKSKGWSVKISDAGKVAYQMLRHLGGPWGIIFLQGKKLIEYLVGKNDEIGAEGYPQPSSGIDSKAFKGKAKEIYNDHHVGWGEEKFIKSFFEYNIFQIGTELQCDVCSRRSWYRIDNLSYTIQCPHCLDAFEIPSHNPEKIKWSYKTVGPFSAAGKAAGAYSVLLTAKFFNRDAGIDNSSTTILSFEAKKENVEIEADLGLFYRERSYSNRSTELIFCECKTFKHFTIKDVHRMKVLAKAFPGAMLVFSTLNDGLAANEKKIIKPFVETCNKYYERDRPKNPVMILTANELYSYVGPPYCWENKGGKYKAFSENIPIHSLLDICQATQMIYLNVEPWWEGWEKEWKRRAGIRALKGSKFE
jgi:hypothetical protein